MQRERDTYRQVHSPPLEVNYDDEHQRGREEVGDVGQVLPVERLFQGLHLRQDQGRGATVIMAGTGGAFTRGVILRGDGRQKRCDRKMRYAGTIVRTARQQRVALRQGEGLKARGAAKDKGWATLRGQTAARERMRSRFHA